MTEKAECARCHRERWTNRMIGTKIGDVKVWVCAARTSCKVARRAWKKANR